MLCPLIKSDCVQSKCAWWDHSNKSCAVLGIVCEIIKASEYNAPATRIVKEEKQIVINPVVQVKEIIKHVFLAKGINDSAEPSVTGEITPNITW